MLFATLADRPFSPETLGHFPLELLVRGRRFSQEVRTVSTLRSLASLATLLWICFHSAGAAWLKRLEAVGKGRLGRGLLIVTLGVSVLLALVELPFAFYLGYWHERLYGLSHQTGIAWFLDWLMGEAVNVIVNLLLWLPLYWMIRRWPRRWWFPAAIMNIGFSGLMILVYPLVLLPLFNPLSPVRDPQVLSIIQEVSEQAGVAIDSVQQLEVSAKSSRVNAMVTGLGPTKQIILYDTLLHQFRPEEIKVVIAHELSHAVHHDVAIGWLLAAASEFGLLLLLAWSLHHLVGIGHLDLPVAHAPRSLALILLFMVMVGHLTGPIQNLVSRRLEVRADRYALEVTQNPRAFVSGFKKLATGNPGDVDPPLLVEFLDYSHPSIMNRIRAALSRR
jgi:STE24 endopeptidase